MDDLGPTNQPRPAHDRWAQFTWMRLPALRRDVDYAMLVKLYGEDPAPGALQPCRMHRRARPQSAIPIRHCLDTSHVERQNLTMRMGMRRFTRLTNAFSKKIDNHIHALSLYFVFYNWIRKHKTLRMTPAMAAGLTDKALTMADIAHLVDLREQMALQEKREKILSLSN